MGSLRNILSTKGHFLFSAGIWNVSSFLVLMLWWEVLRVVLCLVVWFVKFDAMMPGSLRLVAI